MSEVDDSIIASYQTIMEKIWSLVPLDVEIDDPHTADAETVNDIHRALYGRDTNDYCWQRKLRMDREREAEDATKAQNAHHRDSRSNDAST